MATVTRQFKDDFETWAAHKLVKGEFTETELESLKEMLRRDLAPGPDQLREGLVAITAAGVEVPATINDHEERYRLWADFFSAEAEFIHQLQANTSAKEQLPLARGGYREDRS